MHVSDSSRLQALPNKRFTAHVTQFGCFMPKIRQVALKELRNLVCESWIVEPGLRVSDTLSVDPFG